MIDIYYCKFFTIKHRGLHVLDPLIRVHSTYRFTRQPTSVHGHLVHGALHIHVLVLWNFSHRWAKKVFLSNWSTLWCQSAVLVTTWTCILQVFLTCERSDSSMEGGGHEEPLHVVANFYFSKQTFLCVKITDRNQTIILNELTVTLPLAFDGQCLQYRRTCEDKNIMIYISHNLTI